MDVIVTQTLPELSKFVADGKARHVGVTGYTVSVLKECIEKSNINVATVLSYSRLTLIDDSLLEYIPFFKVSNFVSHIAKFDNFINYLVEAQNRFN